MPPRPGPIPKEAIEYLRRKGLKPAFSFREVWKEEHRHAFTVAKVMELDILEDVQLSLIKALEEGTAYAKWAKEIGPILAASGWGDYAEPQQTPSRLNTIYTTNMRVARAQGQWRRIDRTTESHPFLMYALGPSDRHRPEHVAWDGIILPADDPWWDAHYPINAWGCKCHVIQLSRRAAERRGGVSVRPAENLEPWNNPETGKIEMIPAGIDPAWNYHPGRDARRIDS